MKALFVGYGGGHVAMLLPVMAALGDGVLMALTTAKARADAAGVPSLGYRDFLHRVDREAALAWGERLSVGNTSPDVSREETLAYLGINYLDLVEQMGETAAAAHHAQHGRYGFRPRRFMRRVLEELQPDVVVATNSPRTEQAAIEAAVELGIPTVALVDLFAQEADPFVHRRVRADLTCVLAESVRASLLARGFAPERVAVTGNPSFDGLVAPANREAARRLRQALGWERQKVILWAGQKEPQEPRTAFASQAEQVLRGMVAADPRLALVVRYHPGEWQDFPRGAGQERVHFSQPNREPPQPLVLASDVVVVQNSTLGLEAAVAGRAVVSLEHSESVRRSFSLAGYGVSVPCHAHADLPAVVDAALQGTVRPAATYATDGRAAERVAGHVRRLALGRVG